MDVNEIYIARLAVRLMQSESMTEHVQEELEKANAAIRVAAATTPCFNCGDRGYNMTHAGGDTWTCNKCGLKAHISSVIRHLTKGGD